MPRAKRQVFAEVTLDRVSEEMQAMMARRPARTPEEQATAEKHAAKFARRIDKAQQRWHAMPAEEQRDWTASYVSERARHAAGVKPPRLADLPMLFAIVTVTGKDAERDRLEFEEREAERRAADARRRTEIAESRAAEPTEAAAPHAERPAPELSAPPADAKPRKRRKGPSFGVVAVQMPDGSRRIPIYDHDDL